MFFSIVSPSLAPIPFRFAVLIYCNFYYSDLIATAIEMFCFLGGDKQDEHLCQSC